MTQDSLSGLEALRSRSGEKGSVPAYSFSLEPFVDAETVSAFLSIPRPEVLRLTREGKIRGYAYKGQLRHVYRYRLSEVSEDFATFTRHPKGTMPEAASVSRRRESNG